MWRLRQPGRCFLAGRRRAHRWLPLCHSATVVLWHCGTVALWHCGTTRQLKSREIRNTSLLSTAEQQTVGACIVLPSVYITAGWLHHDEFPSRRSRLYNMQVVRVKMMSLWYEGGWLRCWDGGIRWKSRKLILCDKVAWCKISAKKGW